MGIVVVPRSTVGADEVVAEGVVCAIVVVALRRLNREFLPRLKRVPLLLYALMAAVAYLTIILGSILVLIAVVKGLTTGSIEQVSVAERQFFSHGWEPIVYPFLVAVGLAFLVELSRRVGPGRILNWLLGKYRTPREEVRVLLMLDLRGSTPIAEKLGALQFSYLLRDFFDDLTFAVTETEAEIVGYVGDEAILSWPLKRGLEDGNPLRAFLLFKESIAKRSAWYMKQYGLVPEFKGALHAGPVVATEVGQVKAEVVLHGDALNAAARILGECNSLSADLLISADLARELGPVEGFSMESLGEVALRGKEERVGIVRASVVSGR